MVCSFTEFVITKAFLCGYRAVGHALAALTIASSSVDVGAASQHSGLPSVAQANGITVDDSANSTLSDGSSEAVSQHSGPLSLASAIARDSAWFEQSKVESDI